MNKIDKIKAKIKEIKFDNSLILVKREMNKLQRQNKFDINTMFWGWIFGIIGFFGFLASTIMSITAGFKSHKDLELMAFVIGVIFIQLVVYVFCIKETVIKHKFSRYYFVSKLVQFGLLAISINYNFQFYTEKTVWNFLLSVLLEIAIIVITTIGGDFRTLNYMEERQIKGNDLLSIFAMWRYNKLQKLRVKIVDEYNKNRNLTLDLTNNEKLSSNLTEQSFELNSDLTPMLNSQGLEVVKSELSQELSPSYDQVKSELSPSYDQVKSTKNIILLKEKNLEELRSEIENYLIETCKNGDLISSGKIREMFDLTESQWKKIKNDLNCVETNGTKLRFML